MGGLKITKATFRKEVLRRRRLISDDEYALRNALLAEKFFSFFQDTTAKCVHSYLPIRKNKEPETKQLIKFFFQNKIKVLVSRSDFISYTMRHFVYDERIILVENDYGIPEPASGEEVDFSAADLILVPLLTFDKSGNRMGYGKGFYDRLLAQARPDAIKIGLSLTNPFDEFHFVEPHDIKLDYCITPFELYRFI